MSLTPNTCRKLAPTAFNHPHFCGHCGCLESLSFPLYLFLTLLFYPAGTKLIVHNYKYHNEIEAVSMGHPIHPTYRLAKFSAIAAPSTESYGVAVSKLLKHIHSP